MERFVFYIVVMITLIVFGLLLKRTLDTQIDTNNKVTSIYNIFDEYDLYSIEITDEED